MGTLNLKINENEFRILNYILNDLESEVTEFIEIDLGKHSLEHFYSLWEKVQNNRGDNMEKK